MANENRNRESARNSGQRTESGENESRRMPGATESDLGETGDRRGQRGGADRESGMGESGSERSGRSEFGDAGTSQRGSNPTSNEEENENLEDDGDDIEEPGRSSANPQEAARTGVSGGSFLPPTGPMPSARPTPGNASCTSAGLAARGGCFLRRTSTMKRILTLAVFTVAGVAALSLGCKQRETSTTTTNTETTRETAVTPEATPGTGSSGMGTSSSLTPTPTNP